MRRILTLASRRAALLGTEHCTLRHPLPLPQDSAVSFAHCGIDIETSSATMVFAQTCTRAFEPPLSVDRKSRPM